MKENKLIRIQLKLKKRNHLVEIVMKKAVKKHKNKKREILNSFKEYDHYD